MSLEESKSAAPILCDLGGTRLRFCIEAVPGDLAGKKAEVSEFLIKDIESERESRPFQATLAKYLSDGKIDPSGRELRLSLPTIFDDDDRLEAFPNLRTVWNFDPDELKREFGFSDAWALNDAIASYYGVFDLMGNPDFNRFEHVEMVRKGRAPPAGQFVLLGPGTGLGSAYGKRVAPHGDSRQLFSKPFHAEMGRDQIEWSGTLAEFADDLKLNNGSRHTCVLKQMSLIEKDFGPERFSWREFFVSGPGLVRIYETICEHDYSNVEHLHASTAAKAKTIVNRAQGGDSQSAKALALFCDALGATIADMVVRYAAHAGVYLVGPLLNEIAWDGLTEFGMVEAFEQQCRRQRFNPNLPIYLVTHPYPELVGLSRF